MLYDKICICDKICNFAVVNVPKRNDLKKKIDDKENYFAVSSIGLELKSTLKLSPAALKASSDVEILTTKTSLDIKTRTRSRFYSSWTVGAPDPPSARPGLHGTAALEQQAEQSLAPSSSSPPTTPASSGRSSTASCQEIAAALNISTAAGRLRRESQLQSEQVSESGLVSVLSRHNTRNLESLVLLDPAEQTTPVRSFSLNQFRSILGSDYRSSVIRPVATSTPSSSPPPNSQASALLGEQVSVIVTPSEVSSIGGEVFFPDEGLSDHVDM